MKDKNILFDRETEAIVYGMQANPVQRMLDFDFVCRREKPSVSAIINPVRSGYHKAFFGTEEILIPVYRNTSDATKNHPKADVMVNFASFRSAFPTTVEALEEKTIKTIAIIAEGIPERKARELISMAGKKKKTIIGPSTVGGLTAGAFRIGNTAGTIENIIESRLYRPGSIGLVTKSGGLLNEMFNICARNADGVFEGIAIGGDMFPGTTLLDHIKRFEGNPAIKMIVCLGEVGGTSELDIAEAIKKKRIKKPVCIWVSGTCAKLFPTRVQFGHAGAKARSRDETADGKNLALKRAGAIVPNSFDDFGEKIKETFEMLKKKGKIGEVQEIEPRSIPIDYQKAKKEGIVRKPTSFICTISDDRGEEATYLDKPISEVVEKGNIGEIISMLWFKKKLPKWASRFIEMVLMTVADHGPCVAGAHNAIVSARAGKGLIECYASGVLTIGPRFGGAIDGAARYFKKAKDSNKKPFEFVSEMKRKGIYIPGIGHRIKSVQNPDTRVELLKNYARKHFPKTEYLDYALEVEKITTAKRNNLILNVDGCIGILFLDLMNSCKEFKKSEIDSILELGALNALFLVGRGIGIVGHIIDQKRLKEGLYRHPQDDVLYLAKSKKKRFP